MGLVIPNQITLVTLNSKCNHSNNVECLFERSVLYSTMGGFWGFEIMGWVSSCVYVLTGMYAGLQNPWRCLCIRNAYLQKLYLTIPAVRKYIIYVFVNDEGAQNPKLSWNRADNKYRISLYKALPWLIPAEFDDNRGLRQPLQFISKC